MSLWNTVISIDDLDAALVARNLCMVDVGWHVDDGKLTWTVTLAPVAHGHPVHQLLGVTPGDFQSDTTADHMQGNGPNLREALYAALAYADALVARASGIEPPAPMGAA